MSNPLQISAAPASHYPVAPVQFRDTPPTSGISVDGIGLEKLLAQGGRPPKAGLEDLHNVHGGPDRVDELGRQLGKATRENILLYRQQAPIVPSVREVSQEALRMLDAYINRTDEMHPWSTELLAQTFTERRDRMPAVGDKVPIPNLAKDSSPAAHAGLERLVTASEGAARSQIEITEDRLARTERVATLLDFRSIRGKLIDQRF